jgi:hypothetical protein
LESVIFGGNFLLLYNLQNDAANVFARAGLPADPLGEALSKPIRIMFKYKYANIINNLLYVWFFKVINQRLSWLRFKVERSGNS